MRAARQGLAARQAEVEQLEEGMSRLGVAREPAEMVRLRTAQERLREAQEAWRREARAPYRPVLGPLYGVPLRDPHFTGRAGALQRVARGLEGELPTVIWGLGGIGKTALAQEAAHRLRWRFPAGVLWLECRGGPPLDALLNQMGAFAGHPEVEGMEPAQRQAVVRALLAELERALLVLDNLEDIWGQKEARDWVRTLPRNCTCLLTTRENPGQTGWPTVEVSPLPGDEMEELFLRLAAAAGVKVHPDDWPLLPKVLDWLQGHPLALVLAVPLAATRGLRQLWQDLQRRPLKGIDAALRLSYERLTPLAQQLFRQLSVWTIPFDHPAALALLPGEDEELASEALDLLVNRALLAFDGRYYACHPLVRQFGYRELEAEGAEAARAAHRLAAGYLTRRSKEGVTPAEALEMVDQWERAGEWEAFADQASALVGSLDRHGHWLQIDERLVRALAAIRQHLADPGQEAGLLQQIGIIAHRRGEWIRAIKTLEQSLAAFERLREPIHTARACNDLGVAYFRKGEWERAIEMYQRSLATYEQLGDTHNAATTLNNLGVVYAQRGEWERAIGTYQQSLATHERLEDIHGMAHAYGNLGRVFFLKGEWEQAIKMYQQAMTIFGHLNDLHSMAQTRLNLGSVYLQKGEWERAIEMYQQGLATFERLGDDHGLARCCVGLGLVYVNKEEWDRAVEMYQQSLATFERLGDDHGVAETWVNLGNAYLEKGEWDTAIKMLQQGLATFEQLRDTSNMARTWGSLGNVYRQKGELERAIEMYQYSLETTDRIGDWLTSAIQLNNLGMVCLQLKQFESARPRFAKAYRIFARLCSPYTQTAVDGLVLACGSQEAAQQYLERFSAESELRD